MKLIQKHITNQKEKDFTKIIYRGERNENYKFNIKNFRFEGKRE